MGFYRQRTKCQYLWPGKVTRHTELTDRAGSECRQHCGSQYCGRRASQQGQHYNKPEGPADPTDQTGPAGMLASQPICRTHGQAQQTILQKLGRQLGISWSSPAWDHPPPEHIVTLLHRHPCHIDNAAHSPASGAAPAGWD